MTTNEQRSNNIRIGIDCTAIPEKRAGAGKYIFHLIKELALLDGEETYVVFAKKQHIDEWNIKSSQFIFVPQKALNRPARILWEQTRLGNEAARLAVDILHSPHYTMPLLGKIKRIVTVHDLTFFRCPEYHEWSKRWFFKFFIRLSARRAQRIITISQHTANDLQEMITSAKEKIRVVHLGVDERYRIPPSCEAIREICCKYGLQEGKYILFVGLLEPRKNIAILLKAYKELIKSGNKEKMVIAGGQGWGFKEIMKLTNELQFHGKVIFTGYISDDELAPLFRGARMFVYPSFYEGFGIPVLESLACGVPVITSNCSSLPEVCGPGGILVNPCDISELVKAMQRLLTDEELHQTLAQRGLEWSQRFSWAQTALHTRAVYRELLGLQGTPRTEQGRSP